MSVVRAIGVSVDFEEEKLDFRIAKIHRAVDISSYLRLLPLSPADDWIW